MGKYWLALAVVVIASCSKERAPTAHLKDPRAYWERAGAHWHLRQLDQALGDMQHACALGMDKACNDFQRMKAIAGR